MQLGSPAKKSIVIVSVLVLLFVVWMLTGKPVLFHVTTLGRDGIQSCGASNEAAVGVAFFNPLRTRGPEVAAEPFLREATQGSCSPTMSSELCQFVRNHQLPAGSWKLVNRWDTAIQSTLLFRLKGNSEQQAEHSGCAVLRVDVQRAGERWQVVGYGLTYGPYVGGTAKAGSSALTGAAIAAAKQIEATDQ